jgi:hypothetical protein
MHMTSYCNVCPSDNDQKQMAAKVQICGAQVGRRNINESSHVRHSILHFLSLGEGGWRERRPPVDTVSVLA